MSGDRDDAAIDHVRNGLVRRSRPIVVGSPCPGQTTESSGNANSTFANRLTAVSSVAARQIGAANPAREQRVADDQRRSVSPFAADRQADAAG